MESGPAPGICTLHASVFLCSNIGADLFRRHDSFAFEDTVKLVRLQILDCIDFSGRPTDLQAVDSGGLVQTKVNAQIVLGKVASAAVNLAGLRHSTGDEFQSRTNRQAVALCPGQFEADPVFARKPMISQDHGRTDKEGQHGVI